MRPEGPLRVLQVHKDFEPLRGGGGTARHMHGLSKALVEAGCDVRVVSPAPEPIQTPYRTIAASPSGLYEHVRWADVVHVHGARSKYAVAGAVAATVARRPFFYTPHAFYEPHGTINALFKAAWDRTAERFLLQRCAMTILLTDVWRTWLTARGIPIERTVIIPNCISLRDLIKRPAETVRLAGSPALLTVGRLDPVKRVRDVIEALADPRLASACFHVVGKGPERSELEALANRSGLAEHVVFHGFVDDAGVARMMAGSDAFVLASEQEGLPTVLLEALLAKLPVVCTQIPGNLAITSVANADSTYPVGNIDALVRRLVESPRTTVTDEAVAALERTFTWEYRAAEVLALYRAAIR